MLSFNYDANLWLHVTTSRGLYHLNSSTLTNELTDPFLSVLGHNPKSYLLGKNVFQEKIKSFHHGA